MDEDAVVQFITTEFRGVEVLELADSKFFFYHPDPAQPTDHKFPFITLVSSDEHDTASNLNRPGVYRLNIGVSAATYRSKFGAQPGFPRDGGIVATGHDFTALDRLMPHPVYAAMSWVCILNPSQATFEDIKPLLLEAYRLAAAKLQNRDNRV